MYVSDAKVEHYKSDWHRLNVKRKAGGLSPVTYQSFLVMLGKINFITQNI